MKPESQKTEYKRAWHDDYLGWICGFANAKGGTIFIGIDDDKHVCGVENAKRLLEDIPSKIRTHLGAIADVSLVRRNGKDVIRIAVPPSPVPVSYHGTYHYRTGSTRQILTGDALTQFLFRRLNVAWDAAETPNGLKAKAFTFKRFKIRYEARANKPFGPRLLESLGLVARKGILTNAGGLFADDCPIPQSRLFCTAWEGMDKGTDAREDRKFCGNILELLDAAENFVKLNTTRRWNKRARDRIDLRSYPERAVTEALVNAFVHRDYLVFGSEVHVDIFLDHMEISSPGGMPDGSLVQDKNPLRIPSDRRNQIIADVMDQMEYMERKGSGFRKILEAYSKEAANDKGLKPEFYSSNQAFIVYLPNLNYDETGPGKTNGEVSGISAGKDKSKGKGKDKSKGKGKDKSKGKGALKTRGEIVKIISKNGQVTKAIIAARLGLSLGGVEKSFRAWVTDGIIRREGGRKNGRWVVSQPKE